MIKRRAEKLTEGVGKQSMVNVRELMQQGMARVKAEGLRDRKRAAGLSEWDAEFPDDLDEMRFWLTTERSSSQISRTVEGIEAQASQALNDEDAEQYLGDEGVLCAGFRASVGGVSDAKAASFAESMENLLSSDGTGKTKIAKVPKVQNNTEPGKAEGTTDPMLIVTSKIEEIKKEMTDATSYGLVLVAHGICADLGDKMNGHAQYLGQAYSNLTKMLKDGKTPVEFLDEIDKIEAKQVWFNRNEDTAKKWVNCAKSSTKGKEKKDKKEKKERA